MDATFATNNNMYLFVVLAELDSTGVPLAYCLDVFEDNGKGERRAMPGTVSGILCQFLRNLRVSGLSLTFFFFGTCRRFCRARDMAKCNGSALLRACMPSH
jgi:hypothetical protein